MFPSVIDLYKLPNLAFLPFGIELCVIIALFIFRNRNKDTRNRKLAEYQKYSELFEADLFGDIDLLTCVEKRISEGGTSVASVEAQIAYVKENLL